MAKICPNMFPSSPPPDGVKVAFVGEAPGIDEEATGIPFIGKAGQELDRWIKHLFLRSQCFIGNLSQERPPGNRLSAFFRDSLCRQPNEKLDHWIDILREQLTELKPNIIIAVGRHPTYILTGREANWDRKGEFTWGSILPCKLIRGLKVMPIPHPAFVIRGMFDLRPLVRRWLKRARLNSEFPEIRTPFRELVVDPTIEEVLYHLDRLRSAKELAFDIETNPKIKVKYERNGYIFEPNPITCISFSDRGDWSISVPFTRGGSFRWTVEVEKEVWRAVSTLLGQEGPVKIAHNLNYDFLQLAARGVYVSGPYWDTLTGFNRSYLDLTKKKLKKLSLMRLAVCTSIYTEDPFYKNDWKDENKTEDWRGGDREFWIYNAKDSAVLHEIKAGEANDLEQQGMLEMFEREMKAFSPLACMSYTGVKRNLKIVEELNEFLGNDEKPGKIDELQKALDFVVGSHINTKSPQQMQKLLYVTMGLPIQVNKSTGRPTTDEGAIAKLYQMTKHPTLLRIKELTRLRGFRSNYTEADISLDERSRTTYNQGRTSTARISSSDSVIGKGKNLQTIPVRSRPGEDDYNRMIKEYKRSFVADDGKVMGKRDYVQAEAMMVAWLAEDLQQMDDFMSGKDIHCRTAEILYDIDYQRVVDGVKNGDPDMLLKRNVMGKPVRHGFNYKLGEVKLSQMFAMAGYDVPRRESRRLLQAMASGVPAVLRWQQEVEDTVRSTRRLTNPFSLTRLFLGIIDNDAIREAIAFVPQSTVGQMMNFALARIYYESGIMHQMDFLLQNHDAIIYQSSPDNIRYHSSVIGELMEIPLSIKGRLLIIPSDLEVGPNWGDLKDPKWKETD